MIERGRARSAALALALVAGVMGYGLGHGLGVPVTAGQVALARDVVADRLGVPATVRGCGPYLAEDAAAHVRLAVFERRADGSVRLVYRCAGGW